MSLTAYILAGYKPTFRGTATVYRIDDRDPQPEPPVVITEEVKAQISPASYDHMIGKKVANISSIIACIRNGINSQPAIHKATGISQGTISIRLAVLEAAGDVIVNRKRCPWAYSLPPEDAA